MGSRPGFAGFDAPPMREEPPLPTEPPFTAFIVNLSFDSTEAEIMDFFETLQVRLELCQQVTDRQACQCASCHAGWPPQGVRLC